MGLAHSIVKGPLDVTTVTGYGFGEQEAVHSIIVFLNAHGMACWETEPTGDMRGHLYVQYHGYFKINYAYVDLEQAPPGKRYLMKPVQYKGLQASLAWVKA